MLPQRSRIVHQLGHTEERRPPEDFQFSAALKIPAMARILPLRQDIKVFCFFSSEKKTFHAARRQSWQA
jgi:hypothetical protein